MCILFWSRWDYSEFRYCGVVGVPIIFLQLPCFFCPPNIICNAFTTKQWSYENKRCISGGESNLFDLRDTNSQLNSMLYLSIGLSTYLPIKPSWNGNIQVFEKSILWNASLGPAALSPFSEMRKSQECFSSSPVVHVSVGYFASLKKK